MPPRPAPTGTPLSTNNNGPIGTLDVDIDAVIQMATARAAASGSGVRSPNGRDTRTQLYVGNLPYRVRWQDLKDLFRKAGTVLRADVSLGSDNRSRGYGTVLLATAEDAGRAIDMFNGYVWQTRTLEVRPDRLPPPDAEHQAPHTGPSPLHAMPYVPPTNLPPGAGGISQAPWLSVDGAPARPQSTVQFGDVERPGSSRSSLHGLRRGSTASVLDGADVFRARNRSASPGADIALSVQSNSPFVYPHKDLPNGGAPNGDLRVTPPMAALNGHSPHGTLGRSVFVGNLPFHVQWQDLKDHFRSAGQIARADVATGPDGRSRGFGTVLFVHESDALQAVEMFNGKEYHGRPLKVHFDKYSAGPSISPSINPTLTHPTILKHPSNYGLPLSNSGSSLGHQSQHSTSSLFAGLPPSISQASMSSASDSWPPPMGQNNQPDHYNQLFGDKKNDMPDRAPLSPGSPLMPQRASSRHDSITNHPHHPGPISLPSAGMNYLGGPLSPLMTQGLPPMTPTMPGFLFHPQVQTPPLHPHFLSPGIGPFSPVQGSPFFHPHSGNWNPAPGAPLHMPQSPASPPPLAGFNPNYPPFPSFGTADSMANGNVVGESGNTNADVGPEERSYFAAVMSAARANGDVDSGKNSELNSSSGDTTESSAISTAPSQISFGFGDTVPIPTASELGLGLGLSDVMNNLSISEGVPKLSQPAIPPAGVARDDSPVKRAQTTTPANNMLKTPTPPDTKFPVSVEEDGDIPAIVPNAWARSSFEGLVPPTMKSDRRSSWGGRNGP
ncbi:hypothetical protein CALCODRAFT_511644 [Calocera cornea HHB12733]|uniref:RRM domain-containing protein n=1 Tax=Calocera cornea HHB12733 TaxID=1353952 RepID=A0A165DM40_9BASI|nr:hypothetical protein CALCODRAFT_511644 [Calocera cornea HHB12733]